MQKQTTNKTEMVAPVGNKIRMRAIRPCAVNDTVYNPGQEFECDSEQAEQFTKPMEGYPNYSGYANGYASKNETIIRAEIVKE